MVGEVVKGGVVDEDVNRVGGFGVCGYRVEGWVNNGEVEWGEGGEK